MKLTGDIDLDFDLAQGPQRSSPACVFITHLKFQVSKLKLSCLFVLIRN